MTGASLRLGPGNNDDIIPQRPGLKTGVKNFIFSSEIGSGFREPAAHPHHEFPGRSTPLPRVRTPTPTPPPPPNKAIKFDGQKNVFKHPDKICFNFLPDYITNFPLHSFQEHNCHTPSLYLMLVFNIPTCEFVKDFNFMVSTSILAFMLLFHCYS